MGECILCALSKLVSTIVALYDTADPLYNRREHILVGECILCLLSQLFSTIVALYDTADPRRHETPNLDWRAEFWNAESRFSQLLYQQGKRAVQKLRLNRDSAFQNSAFQSRFGVSCLRGSAVHGLGYRLLHISNTLATH